MHNVVKWQTYFKNLAVFTQQDFESMFCHFTTLCMKGLKDHNVFIYFSQFIKVIRLTGFTLSDKKRERKKERAFCTALFRFKGIPKL